MSQIAAALARSKGKKVDPVASDASVIPEIHTSTPPMPTAATPVTPPKFTPKHIAIASGAAILVSVLVWFAWPSPPPPVAPKKIATVVPPPKPAEAPVATAAPANAPDLGWDPKLEEQIRKLPITARRAGSGARIVVGKKIYEPGDTVIEGAILDSVLPDRIVFRDAQNHLLDRRF